MEDWIMDNRRKTIYVPQGYEQVWQRVEARSSNYSRFLLDAAAVALGDVDRIDVRVGRETVSFYGRWIVDADLKSDSFNNPDRDWYAVGGGRRPEFAHPKHDEIVPVQWRAGIAETDKGRIAVYLHHWNYDTNLTAELHDFDTLADARAKLGTDERISREAWIRAEEEFQRSPSGSSRWLDI